MCSLGEMEGYHFYYYRATWNIPERSYIFFHVRLGTFLQDPLKKKCFRHDWTNQAQNGPIRLLFVTRFFSRCFPLLSSCMLLGNNSNIFLPILRFFFIIIQLLSLMDELKPHYPSDLIGPSQRSCRGQASCQMSPHRRCEVTGVAAKSL